MRVLHLISSGGMYGAEAVILQLAQKLNGAHRTHLGVFSHAGSAVPTLHEVATRTQVASALIHCKGQIDLKVPSLLRRMAERTGADVIHAHGYKADIYAHLAFRGARRPALVSTCHTWYDNDVAVRLYGAADRWVLRSFDQVAAVSAEVKDRLLQAGVSASKVHLIRNGVAVPENSGTQGDDNRESRPLRVGLVGRLAPEKGVDLFLRAAAQVLQQQPSLHIVIAGDGPERSALEQLHRELKLRESVQLLGEQRDMPAFYRSLDLMVSASRQEGLPMALLEGMAAGLPVVATAVGEVPAVVVDGQTGRVVPPEDPEALARAVLELLSDPAQRRAFGEAGRERIVQVFSAQRMATDYLALYETALRSRPAVRAANGVQ